jgi:uncharacterized coiled-coil protein SlyX
MDEHIIELLSNRIDELEKKVSEQELNMDNLFSMTKIMMSMIKEIEETFARIYKGEKGE